MRCSKGTGHRDALRFAGWQEPDAACLGGQSGCIRNHRRDELLQHSGIDEADLEQAWRKDDPRGWMT